jgi:hypothetical protein
MVSTKTATLSTAVKIRYFLISCRPCCSFSFALWSDQIVYVFARSEARAERYIFRAYMGSLSCRHTHAFHPVIFEGIKTR